MVTFVNKDIIIQDWTGTQLYFGSFENDQEIDKVLEANRCKQCHGDDYNSEMECDICDGSGYAGEFEIFWVDESDKKGHNVYEYTYY